ncbi:MAG: hypothetical protein KC502_08720 [Myxococcales bacterium]|nr:hypothetical protein [Myxococcales bacterium]
MRHLVRAIPDNHAAPMMFAAAGRLSYGHPLEQPATVFGVRRPRTKLKIPVAMTTNEV